MENTLKNIEENEIEKNAEKTEEIMENKEKANEIEKGKEEAKKIGESKEKAEEIKANKIEENKEKLNKIKENEEKIKSRYPTVDEAIKILHNVKRKDNDLLFKHSQNAAIVAERLATALNLDGEKAYVLGLLHDIGRGTRTRVGIRHIIEGYNEMMKLGYDDVARVCLTHSFFDTRLVKKNLSHEGTNLTRSEIKFILDFIHKNGFNIYDKIIQIADNMGSCSGICTIERRRMEAMIRYGIFDASLDNLKSIFSLQKEFEDILGYPIYKIFPEVTDNINKTFIKDVAKFLK